MDNLLTFALLGFAAYRLARMLVSEELPFGIAHRLRDLVGASDIACIEQSKANRILNPWCCVHCMGVYCAALMMVLWTVGLEPVVWLFAISGAVSWLYD